MLGVCLFLCAFVCPCFSFIHCRTGLSPNVGTDCPNIEYCKGPRFPGDKKTEWGCGDGCDKDGCVLDDKNEIIGCCCKGSDCNSDYDCGKNHCPIKCNVTVNGRHLMTQSCPDAINCLRIESPLGAPVSMCGDGRQMHSESCHQVQGFDGHTTTCHCFGDMCNTPEWRDQTFVCAKGQTLAFACFLLVITLCLCLS